MKNKLIVGTRGSKLALWQAHHVADRLTAAGLQPEIVIITTKGDVVLDRCEPEHLRSLLDILERCGCVITEREGQDGRCEHGGRQVRQQYIAEGLPPAGSQIERRLDQAVRQRLQAARATSILFDSATFTLQLERLLLEMSRRCRRPSTPSRP